MSCKIFYSAYTCKGNLGDLVINKMQIEEYSRYGEVFVDFTGMPDDFRQIILAAHSPNIKDFGAEYGKSYRVKGFLGVIKFLHREGFTHFTKSPGPYAVLSLPLKRFAVRLLGAIGYLYAHHLNMKVFVIGIDLDYSNQPRWLQCINKWYFSHYDVLGLRSQKNLGLLKDGLKNVMYIPDMAFLYQPHNCTTTQRRKIALSFRRVDDKNILIKELTTLSSVFSIGGYSIDVLYQVEEDEDFAKELQKELKEFDTNMASRCIWYDDLAIYGKYDFVFSNRLHVLLLAAKHGAIPFAFISKDIKELKIANIYSSIGIDNLLGYIGNVSSEQWHQLLGTQSDLKREVKDIFAQQELLCKKMIKNFFIED